MHLLCRLVNASRAGGGQGSLDLGNIVGSIASGGVGGGVLLAIVGTIKNVLSGGKGTPKA